MNKLLILLCMLIVNISYADPYIVDPQTGKFLGNLNTNPYDPNSVANPYGRYGSQYSPDSINNPYGKYGNPYSPNSATNPYGLHSPIILDDGDNR